MLGTTLIDSVPRRPTRNPEVQRVYATTDVIRQHIEIVGGAGGPKARIAGFRVRVEDVVIWHERLGMSPDDIVDAIPTLTLADVHAALAYWDHRDEIERQIEAGRATVKEFTRLIDPGPLAGKLEHRLG